mmetsp:Transcript_75189/g.200706  ORF Transcript_75189/g.200706 Transcript_75189/m.200706 type:complete len:268 (-) Transcript_75189:1159-1962(-)
MSVCPSWQQTRCRTLALTVSVNDAAMSFCSTLGACVIACCTLCAYAPGNGFGKGNALKLSPAWSATETMLGTILVKAPCKLCIALIWTRFTVRIAESGIGTGAASITTCKVGCFKICSTRGFAPLAPNKFAVRSRKTRVPLEERKFSAIASAARSVSLFFASTSWVIPVLTFRTFEAKIPFRSLRGRVMLPWSRFWAAEKQGQKISVTEGFCWAAHFTTSAWALAYSVSQTSLFSIISKMEISSTEATTLSPSRITSANSSTANREI